MAPQQNSTFINENLDDCPSFLSKPEEINHYSPILPPRNKENLPKSIKNNNYHNNRNNCQQYKDDNEQHKNKFYRNGSSRSVFSRRSRSISLYGVNSTVEQGHKEITIWLNDEPRYVSGVTNKTTCNDIIKALIDDEISNGNYEYCQLLEDGAASRDYNDYVITECWRGIERSYDGNMAILPVWKAWSRVQNEIRLSLKHHKDIQDPIKALKTNTTLTSIRNYICKLLSFGKCKKVNSKTKQSKTCKKVEEKAKQPPCDVILLLNPETNIKQKQEACHKIFEIKTATSNIKSSFKHNEMETKTKINNEKLSKLMETRASVRKRRSHNRRKHKKPTAEGKRSNSKHTDAGNFLRKRKDSCIRRSVRNKLAQKNAEMNELYQREYALTRELTNKCKMYKMHNGLYTIYDRNLEMSVGQIQCNIEACAKEIIQTEHELLTVKNEIKNDISIINNLKRLTLETDTCERNVPIDIKNVLKTQTVLKPTVTFDTATATSNEQMQFVDNIYEFCDNNASMLV